MIEQLPQAFVAREQPDDRAHHAQLRAWLAARTHAPQPVVAPRPHPDGDSHTYRRTCRKKARPSKRIHRPTLKSLCRSPVSDLARTKLHLIVIDRVAARRTFPSIPGRADLAVRERQGLLIGEEVPDAFLRWFGESQH